MRMFVDREGDLIAIEGDKAVCWTPGLGWGGSEALAPSILGDERKVEIPPEEVLAWLEMFGASMPNFDKAS